MRKQNIIFVFIVLLLFVGCGTDSSKESEQSDTEFTKLSTNNSVDQKASNHAKDVLSKHDEIKNISAVNSSDKLIIAIEIDHMKRFLLKQIEEDLKKEMKKEFNDYKVELSSDKKILLELEKLEKKITSDSISKKKLEKEVDQIIKLSHEQT